MALPKPKKPDADFLENVKQLLQKRYDEGKKWVDTYQPEWEKYREMYNNTVKNRNHSWEANLVIPKSYYIVQTITPQILSAIFGFADFLTLKHPSLPESRLIQLGRWFTWFLLRKMNLYMRCIELFTESPTTGTAMLKLFMRNGVPAADFLKPEDFIPDPRAKKPGDVDSMGFCFNRFQREFGELERASANRLRDVEVEVPISEIQSPVSETGIQSPVSETGIQSPVSETGIPSPVSETGIPSPVSTSETSIPSPMSETVTITMPQLVTEAMYFNLDEVWRKYIASKKDGEGTTTADERMQVDIPNLTLVEHWGEIETSFGVYDVNNKTYKPGKYEEYVVTAVMDGDTVDTIIRCEPSEFYYQDPVEERRRYLKPYVASIYSAVPGTFYGKGAIEPVESLITEMKEHHDLYLDEHKRSVMTILSVLERSGLTPRDLEFAPYAHWVMRNHDDVLPIKFPEVNLQAFNMIHGLIDREIDRTSGSSTLMQGVPTTKRQTLGEVQSLMSEASRRFTTFLQMADHVTLRPLALKSMIMMKSMPAIINGSVFNMPEDQMQVDIRELLDDMEFQFAATGIEPEYSKYAKQEMFPKIIHELAGLMQMSGGQYRLNAKRIMDEMTELYNMKYVDEFIEEAVPMVPLPMIQAAVQGDAPMEAAASEIINRVQLMMTMAEEGKQGSGNQ